LGLRRGRRFGLLLFTMFFFLLSLNLAGVGRALILAGTYVLGLPLLLALWTFVTSVAACIRKHGVLGYVKSETMPPGIPWPIYFLLVPIELLQVVAIRWASLTIRLLAHIFSGHM